MSTASLYELTAEFQLILAQLDTEDGEIPADLDARLDEIAGDFADKIDSVLRARVNLTAQADGAAVELKRLTELIRRLTGRADWLKGYVFTAMLATGQQKLETKLFKLGIQASPPTVKVDDGLDAATLPAGFQRTRPATVEPDKAAMLVAWKAWRALPEETRGPSPLPAGVTVIENTHLRIR